MADMNTTKESTEIRSTEVRTATGAATNGLVLFDLDGTLTDPRLGITSGVQHALKKFGIEVADRRQLESFIGPPLRQTFMEQYGLSEEDAKQAVSYYREYFDPVGWRENEVYPGIPEALEELRSAGYTIALATSKPTVFAERILNHFGLRDAFSVVMGSNLDGTRENKADVVAAALAEAGVEAGTASPAGDTATSAENTASPAGDTASPARDSRSASDRFGVMIGDRKYDIIGGKHWDLATIGVTYGFGSREELQSAGADVIVDTPQELAEAVATLARRAR